MSCWSKCCLKDSKILFEKGLPPTVSQQVCWSDTWLPGLLTTQAASQQCSQPAMQPASQPTASQQCSQPAMQPAMQPANAASQLHSQQAMQPASYTASQQCSQPATQPARNAASQPATKQYSQPSTWPGISVWNKDKTVKVRYLQSSQCSVLGCCVCRCQTWWWAGIQSHRVWCDKFHPQERWWQKLAPGGSRPSRCNGRPCTHQCLWSIGLHKKHITFKENATMGPKYYDNLFLCVHM